MQANYDGFKATTYTDDDFLSLTADSNVVANIYEVDNSTLFCEMRKK